MKIQPKLGTTEVLQNSTSYIHVDRMMLEGIKLALIARRNKPS